MENYEVDLLIERIERLNQDKDFLMETCMIDRKSVSQYKEVYERECRKVSCIKKIVNDCVDDLVMIYNSGMNGVENGYSVLSGNIVKLRGIVESEN